MIRIRQAEPGDVELYYDWVNESQVRKNSINNKEILFKDHSIWFEDKIKNSNSYLFILVEGNIPVGQIRFDKDSSDSFWIDYSVDKNFRGRNFGSVLVKMGIKELIKLVTNPIIKAQVIESNMPSIKVFEKLNFRLISKEYINNQLCYLFQYNKDE